MKESCIPLPCTDDVTAALPSHSDQGCVSDPATVNDDTSFRELGLEDLADFELDTPVGSSTCAVSNGEARLGIGVKGSKQSGECPTSESSDFDTFECFDSEELSWSGRETQDGLEWEVGGSSAVEQLPILNEGSKLNLWMDTANSSVDRSGTEYSSDEEWTSMMDLSTDTPRSSSCFKHSASCTNSHSGSLESAPSQTTDTVITAKEKNYLQQSSPCASDEDWLEWGSEPCDSTSNTHSPVQNCSSPLTSQLEVSVETLVNCHGCCMSPTVPDIDTSLGDCFTEDDFSWEC